MKKRPFCPKENSFAGKKYKLVFWFKDGIADLNKINNYYTYCSNCVVFEDQKEEKVKKTKKNWGSTPINEVSENIQSLNLDKRSLRKTGRVHLFAARVKKEWIEQLKTIAYEGRKHYNEVLEKALECCSKRRSK